MDQMFQHMGFRLSEHQKELLLFDFSITDYNMREFFLSQPVAKGDLVMRERFLMMQTQGKSKVVPPPANQSVFSLKFAVHLARHRQLQ